MPAKRSVCLALALWGLLSGCAKGVKIEKKDPFVTSKEEFQRRVKVIGLAEVTIPDGMPDPGPIQQTFGALIEERIRRGRYTVVKPHEYTAVWDRVTAEAGGLADSTGERDPSKVAAAMARTLDELKAGFQIDAALIPRVVVVEARFSGGRAEWDGVSQSIKTGGPVQDFLAGSPEGKLAALSLSVTIVDRAGNLLYSSAGGIEVLSKLSGKDLVLVPRPELFTNAGRNEEAVKRALEPLLD